MYDIAKNNDFSEICITSSATLINDDKIEEDIQVISEKAEGIKCPICWKISKDNCKKHGHLTN